MVEDARQRGRLILATAYADFRRADMEDLQLVLFQLGFRLVHCPSWPSGGSLKSVVDPVMAQDLRDTLESHPEIDVFMIGTGDRDFIPVAHALRYHSKRVIIVASLDSANRELIACADEFVALPASTPRVIEPLITYAKQARSTRRRRTPPLRPVASPAMAPEPAPRPLPVTPVVAVNQPAPAPLPHAIVAAPSPAATVPSIRPVSTESPAALPAGAPAVLTRDAVVQEVTHRQQTGDPPTPRQLARALVPEDDPDGRLRSFVSNLVSELIKEGKLIRVQVRQHGRLVEAVAVPDGVFGHAAPSLHRPEEPLPSAPLDMTWDEPIQSDVVAEAPEQWLPEEPAPAEVEPVAEPVESLDAAVTKKPVRRRGARGKKAVESKERPEVLEPVEATPSPLEETTSPPAELQAVEAAEGAESTNGSSPAGRRRRPRRPRTGTSAETPTST